MHALLLLLLFILIKVKGFFQISWFKSYFRILNCWVLFFIFFYFAVLMYHASYCNSSVSLKEIKCTHHIWNNGVLSLLPFCEMLSGPERLYFTSSIHPGPKKAFVLYFSLLFKINEIIKCTRVTDVSNLCETWYSFDSELGKANSFTLVILELPNILNIWN